MCKAAAARRTPCIVAPTSPTKAPQRAVGTLCWKLKSFAVRPFARTSRGARGRLVVGRVDVARDAMPPEGHSAALSLS